MPPKKKTTATQPCCVCCQPISIGKDEALYCTGRYQQWLHRYCASVSDKEYKEISDCKTSFQCPTCYREFSQQQKQELCGAVSDLKHELEQLKSELRTANAPSREVPRADLSTTDPASTSTCQNSNPWNTVQVKRCNKKVRYLLKLALCKPMVKVTQNTWASMCQGYARCGEQ